MSHSPNLPHELRAPVENASPAMQFVTHARRVRLVYEETPEYKALEHTFMKYCPACFQITPHLREPLGSYCVVCGPDDLSKNK